MERYFIINDINTYKDWSLILTSKDITPPDPKTKYVDIDGMSGSLDLSEALSGEIRYADRKIMASFLSDHKTFEDREILLRKITSAIHGRKVKIVEPDDPDHYFIGRPVIKNWNNNKSYATFTVEAVCNPWRYAIQGIAKSVTLTGGSVELVLHNDGVKTVIPTVTISGAGANGTMTMSSGSQSITRKNGSFKGFKLYPGDMVLSLSGTGTIKFEYEEASL